MRAFGLEITGNARTPQGNRKDLCDTERAAIVAARMAGVPRRVLADNFDVNVRTISRTVTHFNARNTLKSLPRKGRPQKLSLAQQRYVIQMVKRRPRISWAALTGESGVGVCKNTLRKVLGTFFRRKWRAQKRIALSAAAVAQRLTYTRHWRGKEVELVKVRGSDHPPFFLAQINA
jgi:transposase